MINYHFLLQRYLDASVMSGGALEELGVSPEAVEECGIYQALLKVIDKRNLQAHQSPWNIGSCACLEGIGVYPAKNWQ